MPPILPIAEWGNNSRKGGRDLVVWCVHVCVCVRAHACVCVSERERQSRDKVCPAAVRLALCCGVFCQKTKEILQWTYHLTVSTRTLPENKEPRAARCWPLWWRWQQALQFDPTHFLNLPGSLRTQATSFIVQKTWSVHWFQVCRGKHQNLSVGD